MTSRFEALAAARKAEGHGVFVPFLVIGDPDPDTSLRLARGLVQAGADALELGLPFSDPPADGPVVQAADQRSLAAGTTTTSALAWIGRLRETVDVPISLLVYFNLVLQHGVEAFYARCGEVGVDAVLVADLPPEHSDEVLAAARAHGVSTIYLASELSTPARLERIAAVCEGYVYALARVGVTGQHSEVVPSLGPALERMRAAIDLPLLVGFGISTPANVRSALEAGADGVIVGSALVRHIEHHLGDPDAMEAAMVHHARELHAATRRTP
ncbi:MAG: tryptophan synthase subunit alpha [Alphaproteobacteria bacterium]|nr:tryptophan synthase subunit alpha [Alphaproteobacteria bacterium]